MRRVVVTGIGMCSPLGYGVEYSWSQLLKSKSGIRELSGFDTANLSSQVGGQIPKEGNSDLFPEKVIEIKEEKKMEPFIQFALIAAKEAILDSGWNPLNEIDSENGCNDWFWNWGIRWYQEKCRKLGAKPKKDITFFHSLLFD